MKKEHARTALEKAIQEKKIDPLMKGIARAIAQTEDYFTTSTCSGRITLMDLREDEGKKEGAFFRKWHRKVKTPEVWKGITDDSNTGNLWFKQDPFVYVIGTRDAGGAQQIIAACQEAGIKRYGIHHLEEGNIIMEIYGTHTMSVPVKKGNERLVEAEYVQSLVEIANRKWEANENKRKRFEEIMKKKLE